jgi:hypothetical protein
LPAAALRGLSRLAPPAPADADQIVVRVDRNNVARLGAPKPGPRPRQLLSLPPFPAGDDPLPGRKVAPRRVTAVSWVKHYFADVPQEVVQAHFNKRMVCGHHSSVLNLASFLPDYSGVGRLIVAYY